MDERYVPKINCRFKIRKDIGFFIGFFQTKGVLTFNEVGAFVVNHMRGGKNIGQIAELTKSNFPDYRESARRS